MRSFLSVGQVAERLNLPVSATQIYTVIAQGKLRVNRSLGKLLVEDYSLIELMAGPVPVPSEPPPLVRPRDRPKKDKTPLW